MLSRASWSRPPGSWTSCSRIANAGLASTLLSVSKATLQNAHNACEYSSANMLVQAENQALRAELTRNAQLWKLIPDKTVSAIKALDEPGLHIAKGHKATQLSYDGEVKFDRILTAPKRRHTEHSQRLFRSRGSFCLRRFYS